MSKKVTVVLKPSSQKGKKEILKFSAKQSIENIKHELEVREFTDEFIVCEYVYARKKYIFPFRQYGYWEYEDHDQLAIIPKDAVKFIKLD